MTTIKLTLELLEKLDIQSSRLLGLAQDPRYCDFVEEYDINHVQCNLWLDISRILAHILDRNEYEDIVCDYDEFGLMAKKIMASMDTKFMHLKQLLAQCDVLHDNYEIGKVLHESMEDIQDIYKSIEVAMSKLLTNPDEIKNIFG
ncbi:hypothetical protein [Candidatus Uabimicrobium sp. HlEnr_7]|uniref:hypothetical protein n=1 Tax=Candidatus Uabimicrobium helgolandensis TaxID=3095367 RepID=UPI0035561C49